MLGRVVVSGGWHGEGEEELGRAREHAQKYYSKRGKLQTALFWLVD